MPTMQAENYGELLRTTQNELGKPSFTNLMDTLIDYPAAKSLMKKNQMKVQSGAQIQWNVAVADNGQAANVAITDHDQIGQRDGQVQAVINWRKTKTDYSCYHEFIAMNREPARIVDLVKFGRAQAMTAFIKLMEQNFWRFPAATDVRTPLSLPYWCTKNATEGLFGGIPTGYSSVANLSPTTYDQWNNWSGQYGAVTSDDLIRMARKMARNTGFKPAVDNLPSFDKGQRRKYYTNDAVYGKLEELLDSKNDNHGNELAKYDGNVRFRNADVELVPQLNEDTTGPFYQIDWGVFGVVVLSGFWGKEYTWDMYPGQRNVTATILDYVYNFICRDRRKLGVLATGTGYPS